jgi:hypothetical protein
MKLGSIWVGISAHNNRYWKSINPRQTFEVLLHDQKIGAWRTLYILLNTINSELCVSDILQTPSVSKTKCIQIIPSHLMNLFMKQLHLVSQETETNIK